MRSILTLKRPPSQPAREHFLALRRRGVFSTSSSASSERSKNWDCRLTALEGTHAALPPRPSQLIPSEQNQACPQLPGPEPSQTLPVFLPLPSPVLGSSQTIPSEPNQACPQPPCVAKELSQSPPVLTRVLSPAPSHGSDSALLTTPVAGSLKRKAPGDSSRGKRRLLTPKTRLIRNFRVRVSKLKEKLTFSAKRTASRSQMLEQLKSCMSVNVCNFVLGQAIKNAATSMPDMQKMCVLSFDEMHIKAQLQYSTTSDSVYDIRFGRSKVAKWAVIACFYATDSKNQYKVAPRLTDQHIQVRNKMRVKYAAQVLRHSVAASLCMMQARISGIDDCSGTAEFVEHMDKLLDALNSRFLAHWKVLALAMTTSSTHVDSLRTKLHFIRSWELLTVEGRHVPSPPCRRGWLVTIAAVLQVWEQLRAEGLSFLMTNRLNQDCLENFFSVIRQKGGFRESPDTEQFKAAVKALMTENLMRSSRLTNCKEDLDEVLLCDSSFPSGNLPPDVIGEEDADHDHVSGPSDTAPEMDIFEEKAAAYLAGYCVSRTLAKVGQCSQCI
ncbi:uncharacterized protein LOC115308654 [Ixodes scapularis]|uniref:uncharacterized protein LOC115308654 n=1 Tax=Ixodes scapularis TaxID=6945 RepID=UPI001A9DACBF|nr:uncharacterized protein LOC115308654 [Ixodes scapularis]